MQAIHFVLEGYSPAACVPAGEGLYHLLGSGLLESVYTVADDVQQKTFPGLSEVHMYGKQMTKAEIIIANLPPSPLTLQQMSELALAYQEQGNNTTKFI
jgi:hypothetical protein